MGGESSKATLPELVICPFCTKSWGNLRGLIRLYMLVQEAVDK